MFILVLTISLGAVFGVDIDTYPSPNLPLEMFGDKSICCPLPELAPHAALIACSKPRAHPPCEDVTCIFKHAKWLTPETESGIPIARGAPIDEQATNATVYRQAFRLSLEAWAEKNPLWMPGVAGVEQNCFTRPPRRLMAYECEPYDMVSCASTALLRICPESSWICGN